MANETEAANFITIGNALASLVTPAFVNASQAYDLVAKQPLPADSKVVTFIKKGYLVAEDVAESTNYSYSASSEYTETQIQLTAVKQVQGSKLTVEAKRFGGSRATEQNLVAEHSSSHARAFDAKLKALFPSLSTSVVSTSILTVQDFLDARYAVVSGLKDVFSGKLVGWFDFKGVKEIQGELLDTPASAFSNANLLDLIPRPADKKVKGYAGSLLGIEVYQTDGLATTGGDDQGAVYDPDYCFGAAIDVVGPQFSFTGPQAGNGISHEQLSWWFLKVGEINDAAGVLMRSDT
jgi:hypothetical protein